MSEITLYHNPNCGSSRKTLALLREQGFEPQVVEYLKTPPDKPALKKLAKGLPGAARDLLRQRGTPYDELDLGNPKWSEDELLDFIVQHPILLNRPVVATDRGVRVCRPPETVMEILPGQ